MIRKFIDKLLGKTAAAPTKPAGVPLGKRAEIAVAEHGIDPKLVDERAERVVRTLQEAGHRAFIVGGAVAHRGSMRLLAHRAKQRARGGLGSLR